MNISPAPAAPSPVALTVKRAASDREFQTAKALMQAFVKAAPINLDFQNTDAEFENFNHFYKALFVAYLDEKAVGVVGLKDLGRSDDGLKRCEMKRLWVTPKARGYQLGFKLCQCLLEEARVQNYQYMVLDTLKRMKPARRLYETLGFQTIDAYYHNPVPDVIYMGRRL